MQRSGNGSSHPQELDALVGPAPDLLSAAEVLTAVALKAIAVLSKALTEGIARYSFDCAGAVFILPAGSLRIVPLCSSCAKLPPFSAFYAKTEYSFCFTVGQIRPSKWANSD